MSLRTVNTFMRSSMGFFLTTTTAETKGKDGTTRDAELEHKMVDEAIDYIQKALKEEMIRSGNLHDGDNWIKVGQIANEVREEVIKKHAAANGYEDLMHDSASTAQTQSIIYGCLGQYFTVFERNREVFKKDAEKEKKPVPKRGILAEKAKIEKGE